MGLHKSSIMQVHGVLKYDKHHIALFCILI